MQNKDKDGFIELRQFGIPESTEAVIRIRRMESRLLREECERIENILAAMQDTNAPRLDYLFAKALYAYYYQDNQVVMPQGLKELENMLKRYNGAISNSAIRNAIFCTQSYDDIISSIVTCQHIMEYPELANEISQFLSKHNVHLTSNEIISLSKRIEYRLRKMLRKFIANAYCYFKKSIEKNEKQE